MGFMELRAGTVGFKWILLEIQSPNELSSIPQSLVRLWLNEVFAQKDPIFYRQAY